MEAITYKAMLLMIVPVGGLVLGGIGLIVRSFNRRVDGNSKSSAERSTNMHAETIRGLTEIRDDVRENRKELKEVRKEIGNHIKDHAKGTMSG